MRKNVFNVSAAGYATLFLFLMLLPLKVYSSNLFHTIQVSSFSNVNDAQEQFDSIANTLDETQLDHLRIEKIGKYYSVRLGKFTDYNLVEKFFSSVESKLPSAVVMKAYIKEERIVKLYSDSSTVKMKEPGDRSSASRALDQAVSNAPEDEDKNVRDVPLKENLKEIETLVKNNDYTAAFDIITAEIRQQPDHPDLNAWFGMVLLKMDKPSEARGYLEKATRLSPDIPEFHNGLGYSYFFLKRYDEAIDAFNNALRLDPGHLDALTGLCITYAKNDDKEKAMDIYLKIKNIDKKTSNQLLAIIN